MNPSVIEGLISDLSNLKTGWKTSEFWVSLVPVIAAALSIFGVHIGNTTTSHLLIIVWGAVAIVYTAVRTYLKSVHIGHKANLAVLAATVEHDAVNVAKEVEPAVVKAVENLPPVSTTPGPTAPVT